MGSSASSPPEVDTPVAPDDDPYDPRKPEYIVPASTKEVMAENSRMRLRQFRRLEYALNLRESRCEAKARAYEGGVLRHYRNFLHQLHPAEGGKRGLLSARHVPPPKGVMAMANVPSGPSGPPPVPTSSAPATATFFASVCASGLACNSTPTPLLRGSEEPLTIPAASLPAILVVQERWH
mmetsp:Transcript_94120/g.218739  ORF Transcript_94120/g.218739 Transcript_94120/m.218739 type:complete len:180 (+) Transcript_94120:69-608(+)